MLVVSNTSPVINLASIGTLDLLRQQFGEVVIPAAVVDELKLDTDYPGTSEIRAAMAAGWLRQVNLDDDRVARALRRELDNGEAEAIALALQLKVETILMDERDGRSVAKSMGLNPIGVNESENTFTYEDGNLHFTKSISEKENRILHVVVNPNVSPKRIVTLFFDRRLRSKK